MKKHQLFSLSLGLLFSGLALAGPSRPDLVNINTADQATLSAVPGIGKHRAQAIVEYRHDHGAFKDIHDLTQVKGFTEKNLQNVLKRNPGQLAVKT
jgi:competence protein ComEA